MLSPDLCYKILFNMLDQILEMKRNIELCKKVYVGNHLLPQTSFHNKKFPIFSASNMLVF